MISSYKYTISCLQFFFVPVFNNFFARIQVNQDVFRRGMNKLFN